MHKGTFCFLLAHFVGTTISCFGFLVADPETPTGKALNMQNEQPTSWLCVNDNPQHQLAYHYNEGASPAIMFCCGFRSNMEGSKAMAIQRYCQKTSRAFLRFDYRGHGASVGKPFEECTLTDWVEDASCMLDHATRMKQQQQQRHADSDDSSSPGVILVGSSMGAWISLHLALLHPSKVQGIVGIASAPDFLQDIYESSTEQQKNDWNRMGVANFATEYEATPYPISWRLVQDARNHWGLLAGSSVIPVRCRVHLIHGQSDKDISWKKSLELAERLEMDDLLLTFIKSGDHRLSRDQDLQQIIGAVEGMLSASGG